MLLLILLSYSSLQHTSSHPRKLYLQVQRRYHAAVLDPNATGPLKAIVGKRTPDDAVRFLSWSFAVSNAMDKSMLEARIVISNPYIQQRCKNLAWTQLKTRFWNVD